MSKHISKPHLRKLKKPLLICVLCCLVSLVGIGSTYAYLTDNERHANTLSTGHTLNRINETFSSPTMNVGDNIYNKIVTVENVQSTDNNVISFNQARKNASGTGIDSISNNENGKVFVRVAAEFSTQWSRDHSWISSDVSGTTWCKASDYINHLPANWVYIPSQQDDPTNGDALLGGYYYYTRSIAPGESTTALMSRVKTTYSKSVDIEAYNIFLYAESVQAFDKTGVAVSDDNWRSAWEELLNTGDITTNAGGVISEVQK